MQLVASNSDKRQADWATKRVFFCTPEVGKETCLCLMSGVGVAAVTPGGIGSCIDGRGMPSVLGGVCGW